MANVSDFFSSQSEEIQSAILKAAEREDKFVRDLPSMKTLSEDERKRQNDYFLAEISVKEFIRKKYPGRFSDAEIDTLEYAAQIVLMR